MMSKGVFLKGISRLAVAFGVAMTDERLSLYYEKLSHVYTDDDFLAVVESMIDTDQRFPAISVFIIRNPQNQLRWI